MEDEEIVRLYLARDQRAIRETQQAYGRRLQLLANGILQCREDAEESVSDTYLKAWDTIPPQRPRFLYAYLAKICRFLALGKLDWNNAKKRRAAVVELTQEMEECIPDSRREQEWEARELGELLSRFLDTLAPQNRRIFLLRYWYVKSVRETAQSCGLSENNVKIRLHRMRNSLKDYLEKEGVRV